MLFKSFAQILIFFFVDLLEIGVVPVWQNCLMAASANTASINGDSLVKKRSRLKNSSDFMNIYF